MRIGIVGTRGIPNKYGGFEEFAEKLSVGLHREGFEVTVYCSHNHPFPNNSYEGVRLIKCYDPENHVGLFGQFIYDFNCIVDSRKRDFDVIYQLGYTSNGIWQWLLPKSQVSIINMDGMEWKRSKYAPWVKKFLKISEKLAANNNTMLIADSPVIRDYLRGKYSTPVKYITYGASIPKKIFTTPLLEFGIEEDQYYLIIARLQSDNHIEEIIKGVLQSKTNKPLVIVGNHNTKYGNHLKEKYKSPQLKFIGAIFDAAVLNSLRKYTKLYFHGHSAGGTNPSLLEAMSAGAKICAHDNPFNNSVLGKNALYFKNDQEISAHLDNGESRNSYWKKNIEKNIERIDNFYNWKLIIENYKLLFQNLIKNH
jgi:glycosyltransferase involved in cell wall biosynthesis